MDFPFNHPIVMEFWYGELSLNLSRGGHGTARSRPYLLSWRSLNLKFGCNFLDTKVPPPPLSSNALSVTGLGLPIRELNLTKAIGLWSVGTSSTR